MKTLRIASVLLLAAALAGCQGPCQKIEAINGPALTSGSADFTRYVAIGTSISAGYQSSGLVNRHQVHAFPALFAQQVGKTVLSSGAGSFSFPAVDGYGITPLLQLRSISPLVISNSGLAPGNPINIAQAADYQNLAVPGAVSVTFADSTLYYISDPNNPFYNPFYSLVARHRGTLAQQLLRQGPTFVSFELGANEVLKPATNGVATLSVPPATYAAVITASLNAIHTAAPSAKLVIFNVPNVTAIPYCTTFKPATRSLTTGAVVGLVGPTGSLDPINDLVLLSAKDSLVVGTGFPVGTYNYLNPGAPGNGRPLLDSQVLSASEQSTLVGAVAAMNSALDSVATRPWIAKVDLNSLLQSIATNGYTVGSTHYTSAFVTGGLFSLDGVHPTDLGHAIIANAMVDAVNARFGATVPHVDLNNAGSLTSSSAKPVVGGELSLEGMQLEGLQAAFGMIFGARH